MQVMVDRRPRYSVPVLEGWQCAGCRWLPRADILRFAQITTDLQLVRELTELAG